MAESANNATLSPADATLLTQFDPETYIAKSPQWLADRRRDAHQRAAELGFPTRRNEEWRSTPIAPIAETPFSPGQPAALAPTLLTNREITGAIQVAIVNGYFDPINSRIEGLPAGVTVTNLAQALASHDKLVEQHLGRYARHEDHFFTALNTAAHTDGVFIHIPRNVVVEQPIHIIYASQPGADGPTVSYSRSLVIAEENSQATIIERYVGHEGAVYLCSSVTEFDVAQNAVIDHYKIQQESRSAFHVGNLQANLTTSSNFSSHSIGFGGQIVRNDAGAALLGEGCTATLNGLFLATDNQLMDSHTTLDHAMPHCPSHQIYKHVLDGRARAVFNGKIFVRLDAQKTDAKQTNQTILLSPEARIDTKPQLEIFADDVRCTHGATVGQLRPDQLFYLQARGIGKKETQDLLTYGFAADVIERVKVGQLQDELKRELLAERNIEGMEI